MRNDQLRGARCNDCRLLQGFSESVHLTTYNMLGDVHGTNMKIVPDSRSLQPDKTHKIRATGRLRGENKHSLCLQSSLMQRPLLLAKEYVSQNS